MSILTFPTCFCFQQPLYLHAPALENFDSSGWKLWKSQEKANSVSALITGRNRSEILSNLYLVFGRLIFINFLLDYNKY